MGSFWDPGRPLYGPPPICAESPVGLPSGALTVQLCCVAHFVQACLVEGQLVFLILTIIILLLSGSYFIIFVRAGTGPTPDIQISVTW
jgi:hypothetical protein